MKDHQTLKTLADEIKIFEGIMHPNLVQFYGVEIYRVSPCQSYYVLSLLLVY